MKKIKILLLCLLVVLVSGCAKEKDVITTEDFIKVMGDYSFDLVDKTDTAEYADKIYRVSTDTFDFVFTDGKKKYDIEGLFVDQCKNVIDDIGEENYDQKIGSGSNWAYLDITTKDNYYYVSWIGDTFLYIKAPIDRVDQMREIVDKLGY